MFRIVYVPLVVREILTREYLSLKQTRIFLIDITKMFTERALFFLEYASSELVQVFR